MREDLGEDLDKLLGVRGAERGRGILLRRYLVQELERCNTYYGTDGVGPTERCNTLHKIYIPSCRLSMVDLSSGAIFST